MEAVSAHRRVKFVATDFNPDIVGRQIVDTRVISGNETLSAVADAEVAVVTGMTLGNGTFEEILRVAKSNRTKLVIFAQTGANFGKELLKQGASVVVSEPFPFYNVARGPTDIICHRR